LAFHPYPQLIPRFFNIGGCGPPLSITRASPWPWVDHPVSGLQPVTIRPLKTRFRCGSRTKSLNLATNHNSPARYTKSTPSHLKGKPLNSALTDCKLMVSGSISLPSRGAFHLSLTVLSAIGRQVVFSLGRWSFQIHTGFLVPRATRVPVLRAPQVSATGLLPSTMRLSSQLRLPKRFVTLKDRLPPALKTEPTTPDRQRR
jgi:hypothetical protein